MLRAVFVNDTGRKTYRLSRRAETVTERDNRRFIRQRVDHPSEHSGPALSHGQCTSSNAQYTYGISSQCRH
jgi:hypothetical protein